MVLWIFKGVKFDASWHLAQERQEHIHQLWNTILTLNSTKPVCTYWIGQNVTHHLPTQHTDKKDKPEVQTKGRQSLASQKYTLPVGLTCLQDNCSMEITSKAHIVWQGKMGERTAREVSAGILASLCLRQPFIFQYKRTMFILRWPYEVDRMIKSKN